jgi:hypothetical protein
VVKWRRGRLKMLRQWVRSLVEVKMKGLESQSKWVVLACEELVLTLRSSHHHILSFFHS